MAINTVNPDGSLKRIAGLGRGIKSTDIDGNGHLIVTYDDNTTHDAGVVGGGSGDMLASVYDSNGDVASAGGIDEYVGDKTLPIWKAQGELGAKNLIKYPYNDMQKNSEGINWTVNEDGSITADGVSTNYSYIEIKQRRTPAYYPVSLKGGEDYILSLPSDYNGNIYIICRYSETETGTVIKEFGTVHKGNKEVRFTITQEEAENFKSNLWTLQLRAYVPRGGVTVENDTIYPMLRLATDQDDTWQPYAPTNKELADKQNELAVIAGEYINIASNTVKKKRVCEIGATSALFYVGNFVEKYGITSASDLNIDVSSETTSGNVIAYNSVTVNWNTKAVYIYFDELEEAATFVCKASKII